MAEALVKMSGEGEQLMRTLAAIEKGFNKIAESQDKVTEQSKKQAAETKTVFDRMEAGTKNVVAGVLALGTSFVSVAGAVKLFSAEYDKLKSKLDAAAQVGQRFGESIAAAAKNTSIPAGDLETIVKRSAAASGASPQLLAGQLPGILAAGGAGLSPDRLESLLQTTVPVAAGNAQDFGAKAQAVALFRSQGGEKSKASDKAVMGLFGLAAGGSLIDSEAQYSPLVANVMASASAAGLSETQSMAVFNAITKATVDAGGLSSRTAGNKMMSAFGASRDALGLSGTSDIRGIVAGLRSNPQALNKFLDKASFETQNRDAIAQMFRPGTAQARLLDEALANAPTLAGGEAAYDELARSLSTSPAVRSMALGQGIGGAAENLSLDERTVKAGIVREAMAKVRTSSSGWAVEDWWDEKSLDAAIWQGRDPLDHTAGELRKRINTLRDPGVSYNAQAHGVYAPKGFGGGYLGEMQGAPPPRDRTREIEILEQLLAAILRMSQPAPPAANGERPINPGVPPARVGAP